MRLYIILLFLSCGLVFAETFVEKIPQKDLPLFVSDWKQMNQLSDREDFLEILLSTKAISEKNFHLEKEKLLNKKEELKKKMMKQWKAKEPELLKVLKLPAEKIYSFLSIDFFKNWNHLIVMLIVGGVLLLIELFFYFSPGLYSGLRQIHCVFIMVYTALAYMFTFFGFHWLIWIASPCLFWGCWLFVEEVISSTYIENSSFLWGAFIYCLCFAFLYSYWFLGISAILIGIMVYDQASAFSGFGSSLPGGKSK